MKQKSVENKRFWVALGVGVAVVLILLAANLWQLYEKNSVTGAKQVWSEHVEQ